MDAFEIGLQFNRMNARIDANANPALVGLQVTGVPSDSSVASLAWRPAEGLGFSAEWRRASDSAVNALNTVFDGGYSTLDLGLQYVGRLAGSAYRLHARLLNASDSVYASNAFVIGGAELVAPAQPRALQVGLQLDF
jgi:hypothetical protein